MKIHYLMHVDFEGLGYLAKWVEDKNHSLTVTKLYMDNSFPSLSEFDMLIIMGGPMSINDEGEYPWLKEEKEFIRKAIFSDKIVLGICLGAQLIANALGAKVYKNSQKEIGWFDIEFTNEALKLPLFEHISQKVTVFHWHGETFDLPTGAIHLAKSEATMNQSFLFNDKVLGLQFHFEATEFSATEMINHGKHELIKSAYIQDLNHIIKNMHLCSKNNAIIMNILDQMEKMYYQIN